MIDKWEQVLFASEGREIQPRYCGDFEFIKKEFNENSFKLIREHAPQALNNISNKISYLHLNTGDKDSEYKTVKLVYPQITNPGFILIDNYYHSDSEDSIDGFLEKEGNFVIPLGNSQGLVIKI